MPLVTRQCIESIKLKVNIYDVVSPVVTLKKRGRDYWGLSPFTNEKTPSFKIDPEKGFFKCFSSGSVGDIFRFIELTEKLNFNEAVEALSHRFNITLEYENGARGPSEEKRSLRRELLDIHEQATDYFHQAFLSDHPEAESVRLYWTKERGFSLDLAREWKIGYSPSNSRKLNDRLVKKGCSIEAIKQSGLFYVSNYQQDPLQFKQRFRGRLIIPVRDHQGQVVAFSARKLALTPQDDPAKDAKYINSPETPLFHKSSLVFGIDRARDAAEAYGGFILVEGQLDVLRCWTAGFKNAVAPQGTSITEEQLLLLKRYHERLDCVLDGDKAGQKAALRIVPLALKTGQDIRFIVMSPGDDPDSFINREGPEAFRQTRNRSLSVIAFLVRALLGDVKEPTPQQQTGAIQHIFEALVETPSVVLQEKLLDEIAAHPGISVDRKALSRDYQSFLQNRSQRRKSFIDNSKSMEMKPQGRLTTSEYDLLCLILHQPDLAVLIHENLQFDWIDAENIHGRLLLRILSLYEDQEWTGTESIDNFLKTDDERDIIYGIMAEERFYENTVKQVEASLRELRSRHLKQQIEENTRKLDNTNGDETLRKQLFEKNTRLRKELMRPPFNTRQTV